jgi:Glycosyltransferase Family 4
LRSLRVLITNHFLRGRTGSELYVCELAKSLLQRGYTPIVYSPQLGPTARELRDATVPVVDNLNAIASPPDLIHGQHHVETMAALLRFPNTPAVFFCHGWLPWEETPPKHPRILHYVAVDDTCRDRIVWEHGAPEQRVSVILNSVETEQFLPRPPLPAKPARALVFSNGASESTHISAVREACLRTQLTLDVIGANSGNLSMRPQDVLGQYDIVFAKARCALEALAVGSAVVLCDTVGVGPMVTTREMDQLRRLNFGVRALRGDVHADVLEREIARYDPQDAAEVSRRIREGAGREKTIDQIVGLYDDVVREFKTTEPDLDAEARAEATYLQQLAIHLEGQRNTLLNSQTFRLRQRLLNLPLAGSLLRSLVHKIRT